MALHFTKMHGLGNDFIVIDAIRKPVQLNQETIIALARRDTGIGFDQCLVVESSHDDSVDFFYRIFNADGQEVGQCGNGARCLARFLQYYELTHKSHITVATKTTRMLLKINRDQSVTVDFDPPQFDPIDIPLQVNQEARHYPLPLKDGSIHYVHALSVGNPHAITVVNNLNATPIHSLGKEISEHPLFPQQANAGFMEILDKHRINLRVYERGCGETKACGSGAVAAAVVGCHYYQMEKHIEVTLPGGQLTIKWPTTKGAVSLTGPASFVYEGRLCV